MRDSLLRFGALWAVLSGTSPLPMLLASAHAAPGPMCLQEGGDGNGGTGGSSRSGEAGGFGDRVSFGAGDGLGAGTPAVPPASLGTLDELVELWPSLGHADGLLLFVDFEDLLLDGFPLEVWAVYGGDAEKIGEGAYSPLHHGDTMLIPTAGDSTPTDVPLRLAMHMAIGLVTAHDGPLAGAWIGIEGVVIDLATTLKTTPYWGAQPWPTPIGQAPQVAPLPSPVLPARSMSPFGAQEAADEQAAIDSAQGMSPQCVHPTWLGKNGVQCCQLYLSPEAAELECRDAAYYGLLVGCVLGQATWGGLALSSGVKMCVALGVPVAIVACLAALLAVATVILIVCLEGINGAIDACMERKQRENRELLISYGCATTPPGS